MTGVSTTRLMLLKFAKAASKKQCSCSLRAYEAEAKAKGFVTDFLKKAES